jgi:flagellar hook protein FlgE
MSVLGSMFTAVSGLNAQSQRLATISENIANVNTTGYKRIDTKFFTFVTESTSTRHSPGGVQSRPVHNVDAQGTLQSSLSATDVAISGQGMFVVNPNAVPGVGDEYLYTRAGSFSPDANGRMVNTSGYYLQGWPLDQDGNLPNDNGSLISLETVNIGQVTGKPKATSKISMGVNLPANSLQDPAGGASIPDSIRTSDLVVFDSLGIAQTIRLSWTHVNTNKWNLTINPGSYNGTPNSVVDVLDSTGAPIDTTNGATSNANTLSSASTAATNFDYLEVNFNTDGTLKDVRDPSTGVSIYNTATQTADVKFDFSASGADANQTISFNFGRQNNTSAEHVAEGVTQYDADFFTSFVNQNGVRFGSFTGVNITKQGIVTAIFDNGQTQPLYQVPLVSFANPKGLEPRTGNAYAQTERAGEFILRQAGQAGQGNVIASSLEQSTVDIAEEFSNMIITQRAYSANTKVISTANEMLQELIRVTG